MLGTMHQATAEKRNMHENHGCCMYKVKQPVDTKGEHKREGIMRNASSWDCTVTQFMCILGRQAFNMQKQQRKRKLGCTETT